MRYPFAALLLCFAGAVAGADPVEFKPQGLAGDSGVGCDLRNLVPKEFRLFATSAYGGRATTYQIDQSGNAATEFDVAVHSPEFPVVVALASSDPTVWKIGWSAKTRIAAVVVSGSYRQIVLGMPKGTPVLVTSGSGGCPAFGNFLDGGRVRDYELSKANEALRKIVGKSIDKVYPPKQRGLAVLGEPGAGESYVTSNDYQLSDFVKAGMPKAGRAGIEEALKLGVLRVATDADLRKARASVQASQRSADPRAAKQAEQFLDFEARLGKVWVVQSAFAMPAGLYGSHSEVFLLPEGVPEPTGNPGHSTVVRIGSNRCTGPACPR